MLCTPAGISAFQSQVCWRGQNIAVTYFTILARVMVWLNFFSIKRTCVLWCVGRYGYINTNSNFKCPWTVKLIERKTSSACSCCMVGIAPSHVAFRLECTHQHDPSSCHNLAAFVEVILQPLYLWHHRRFILCLNHAVLLRFGQRHMTLTASNLASDAKRTLTQQPSRGRNACGGR